MSQLADQAYGQSVGASGVVWNDNYVVARSFTSCNVDRQLTQLQSGLPVFWNGDHPELPVMTPSRRAAMLAKRGVDIVGAALGLLFLAPLFLLVALAIKLTDKGPVFFRQTRVGLYGVPFQILKFRSMYSDRGDISGRTQTVANDNRVTRIGAFIRKTSIDELPQLVNVLLGDMSLVGPRPHVGGMLAAGMLYDELVPGYAYRYLMRPGITGWAQCNGLRGPTVDRSKALARIGHDIAYIQNYKFKLDIVVLARTIVSEAMRSNAH